MVVVIVITVQRGDVGLGRVRVAAPVLMARRVVASCRRQWLLGRGLVVRLLLGLHHASG